MTQSAGGFSLDDIRDVVFRTDAEGRWTYLNSAWTALTGFPRKESLGRVFLEFVHPDDRELNQRRFEPLVQRKKHHCLHEIRYLTKDGGVRWVEVHARLTLGADGSTTGTAGTLRDISERRRAEADQRLLGALVGHMREAVVALDQDLRIRTWSGGAEAMYGWTAEEAIGKAASSLLLPDTSSAEAQARAANLGRKGAGRAVERHRRKDGALLTVDASYAALSDSSGTVTGILAVCRDVTEQTRAEEALRASEERFRTVVEACGEGIVMWRADGTISAFNPAAEELIGIRSSPVPGNPPTDPGWPAVREDGTLLPTEDRPDRVALRTGRPQAGVVMGVLRPDGALTWLSASAQPVEGTRETARAVVLTIRDVTRERAAAAALAGSEQRLRLALTSGTHAEWDWDIPTDRFTHGTSWLAMLGRKAGDIPDTLSGWKAVVHPDDLDRAWTALQGCVAGGADEYQATYRVRHAQGGWRWVRSRGRVVCRGRDGRALRMIGTRTDVTEVQELQDRLLEATRLASVGTLAAGVAHEINNPLSWVTSNLAFALQSLSEGAGGEGSRPELHGVLDDALRGLWRIAAIVKAMRSLGCAESPGGEDFDRVDVGAEISNVLLMIRGQILRRARLDVDVPEKGLVVRARTNELGRAFLNLLMNAAQAIPEGRASDHQVTVRAREEEGEVVVEVADSGAGIPADARERIFEPFFTTRPAGVGSGLGLTIARNIVERSGGRIEVESREGHGSTFRIRLHPASAGPSAGAVAAGARVAALDPAVGENKRVVAQVA